MNSKLTGDPNCTFRNLNFFPYLVIPEKNVFCLLVCSFPRGRPNIQAIDNTSKVILRNEYRNFKLAMGRRLGRSEEDWKRGINWRCNTHMHGNNPRKLPV
jgi:hypothetical protein